MAFELPSLPYPKDALAPHMSAETLDIHHGRHHKAYVDNLNKLVAGTEHEKMSLEDLVRKSSGAVFNNAAQAWNHSFFWESLTPSGSSGPSGALSAEIQAQFGTLENFKERFTEAALKQFGSGWAWLVRSKQGKLEIVTTANAGCPLTDGHEPLLACDVWEHAYYIDYRNRRADFVAAFWKIANWKFAEANFDKATQKT